MHGDLECQLVESKSFSTSELSSIYLYHIYPPPLGQDMTQGQFFKRSLTGFNSEFSFSYTSCLIKAEEHSLPYYEHTFIDLSRLSLQNTPIASMHRGKTLSQWMSRIWHKTICFRRSSLGNLGNVEYPFIAIAFRSTLTRSGRAW